MEQVRLLLHVGLEGAVQLFLVSAVQHARDGGYESLIVEYLSSTLMEPAFTVSGAGVGVGVAWDGRGFRRGFFRGLWRGVDSGSEVS